jgi:glycosyltransferase involved in cell wall biosynthesis
MLYVSPEFPKTRHGFQAAELEALGSRVEVSAVSLRRPSPQALAWLADGFPGCASIAQEYLTPRRVLADIAWAAGTRPLRLLKSLAALARATASDRRGLAKTLIAGALGCSVARSTVRRNTDWIHADFASAPATAAYVAASLSGRPWSFCAHAFDVFSSRSAGRATRALLRLKATSADRTFAENTRALAILREVGGAPLLKRNGVRVGAAQADGTGRVVVGLGALDEKKGFDIAVRAVALLAERGIDVPLLICGDGPARGRLERLAHELSVRLELPGAFTHAELPAILARAAVVTVPSRVLENGDSDGVPTVLVEALAAGVPVVGSDVGSVSDLVRDGVTGRLVEPESPAALADALEELLKSPAERARLAENGRRLVYDEFDVEVTTEVLLRPLLTSDPDLRLRREAGEAA